MAQMKRQQIVTPKGVAVYPHLNTPDTKFTPEGEYKVNLKLTAEDAAPLIAELTAALDAYHAAQIKIDPKVARFNKALPMDEEVDDQGNLTGNMIFKFKQKASVTTRTGDTIDFKVALFDAGVKPTTETVGGGSIIKVAASVWPYVMPTTKTVGLSLRPTSVQILQLKQWEGSATSMFDKEDGYEAPQETAGAAFMAGDDDSDY